MSMESRIANLESMLCKLPLRNAGGSGTGSVILVDSYSNLPSSAKDGKLGYVKDKDYFYGRRNDTWRIMHPFLQPTQPSSQGESKGDFWCDTDDGKMYSYTGSAWLLLSHLQ